MHVDDLADAAVYFMNKKINYDYINIGTGKQLSITEYAKEICKYLNIKPKFRYDKSKPNGMKTKVVDVHLARKLGWKSKITLRKGIERTYSYYIKNYK